MVLKSHDKNFKHSPSSPILTKIGERQGQRIVTVDDTQMVQMRLDKEKSGDED